MGAERRYLLVVEDDFSRFIVGHRLCEGPTSEVVVQVMVALPGAGVEQEVPAGAAALKPTTAATGLAAASTDVVKTTWMGPMVSFRVV